MSTVLINTEPVGREGVVAESVLRHLLAMERVRCRMSARLMTVDLHFRAIHLVVGCSVVEGWAYIVCNN